MLHSYAADPLAALGSVAMLAVVHAGGGDLTQAREYIHVARSSASALRPDDAAALRLAEASVALEQLDVQAATELMDAAADRLRTSVHWIPAAVLTGMIELAGGHPGRGLAHLDHAARARGAEGRTEAARRAFAPLRALLRLALGHPDSASAILERDAGSPTVLHIGRARAELMLGRHGAALQQLRALSSTVLSTREHANVIALESAALLRFSNERRVGDVVDHLGSLLQRSGLRLPLALLPEPDFDRVADALTAAGYADLLGAGRIRPLLPELGGAGVLSRRETAVLAALVEHPSHTAIAAQLNVSVNTVKSQLRSVYRKLGVSTRDEAIAVAIDRHLLVERE
jgi:LuxR family maltose regulon positive regulatory protein